MVKLPAKSAEILETGQVTAKIWPLKILTKLINKHKKPVSSKKKTEKGVKLVLFCNLREVDKKGEKMKVGVGCGEIYS